MPYIIVSYKKGYRLKKIGEDKYFSKKPMPKAKVVKQRTAIILNELRNKSKKK